MEVVIVAAKRTPIGRFLGSLSGYSAVDLACAAGEATLKEIDRHLIDQVVLGNVLAAGQGMNIARQVSVKLGFKRETTAYTVNMMCASGLQAVLLAAQAIRCGDVRSVLCGGTESMSNAPYLMTKARRGLKLGDGLLIDSVLRDGLVDSFDNEHMGLSAETLAREFQITRDAQDRFAVNSQIRYAKALEAGIFDSEIVPVGDCQKDEHPRADTTVDSLAKLKTAFLSTGTITAGNASGINDGAAMLLVADRDYAMANGWPVLATIVAGAVQGCDPKRMGLGPVHAIRKLCDNCHLKIDQFDTIEINEAFAAQVLACQSELKIENPERLNPHGGAIAIGHPIGASGARLAVHLAHQISQKRIASGLASLCVGGGMGIAAAFKKFSP